jgi:hypothetical protein
MIGPMPDAHAGMPCAPTRRTALGALALAAAAVPLAACGIRLEDDAPRVPLLPTREPVPGEAFLLGLWLGSGDLAELAGRVGGPSTSLPARLAPLHREQVAGLRSLLSRLGIPDRAVADAEAAHRAQTVTAAGGTGTTTGPTTGTTTGTGSPATTATPSGAGSTATSRPVPTTAAPPTTASLAAAEAEALAPESFTELAALPATAVPVAAATLAQRAAAATLLGKTVRWAEQPEVETELAVTALESLRAAVYGFEVVAAQSRDAQRALATTTLATLRARAALVSTLAGEAAAPPALGYPLPFAVTTPAAARRLAVSVLGGLRASHAAAVDGSAGRAGSLASCVEWLAEAEVLAYRWRMAPQPFPGLS